MRAERNSIAGSSRSRKRYQAYVRWPCRIRVPLAFGGGSTSVKPAGYVSRANESMETQVAIITPNYFQTMQIPIVKGRDFTRQDTKNSRRAVIVSEAFANHYWQNQEALSKQHNSDLTHEWFTVVGVVRDRRVLKSDDGTRRWFSLISKNSSASSFSVLPR